MKRHASLLLPLLLPVFAAGNFSLRGDDQRGTSLSDLGTALRLTVAR